MDHAIAVVRRAIERREGERRKAAERRPSARVDSARVRRRSRADLADGAPHIVRLERDCVETTVHESTARSIGREEADFYMDDPERFEPRSRARPRRPERDAISARRAIVSSSFKRPYQRDPPALGPRAAHSPSAGRAPRPTRSWLRPSKQPEPRQRAVQRALAAAPARRVRPLRRALRDGRTATERGAGGDARKRERRTPAASPSAREGGGRRATIKRSFAHKSKFDVAPPARGSRRLLRAQTPSVGSLGVSLPSRGCRGGVRVPAPPAAQGSTWPRT